MAKLREFKLSHTKGLYTPPRQKPVWPVQPPSKAAKAKIEAAKGKDK